MQRLLVLNGARAAARLSELVPMRSVQWAWTPRGPALAERLDWIDTGRSVELRPQWPGGAAPVTVELAVDSALPGASPPSRSGLATTVQVPLGEWAVIGELRDAAQRTSPAGTLSSATASAWALQLRVSAP